MAIFAVSFDEGDVRHLCGPGAFARADALQRASHVLGPSGHSTFLAATVRGTWRRLEQVIVTVQSTRLSPACTCGAGGFCRHVGAVLLHWLRASSSFVASSVPSTRTEPPDPAAPADPLGALRRRINALIDDRSRETPEEEIARYLEGDTAGHLREICRRRGVSHSKARGKADLVGIVAPILASSEGIDAILPTLDADERLGLDLVNLLSTPGSVSVEAVGVAFRALAGRDAAPSLDTLLTRGLLLRTTHYAYEPLRYVVPRAVASRLPPLGGVAKPVAPPTGAAPPRPRLTEVLQVVARRLRRDGIARRRNLRDDGSLAGYLPDGWRVQAGFAELPTRGGYDFLTRLVRLLPRTPIVADDDLTVLATETGQSVTAIAFAIEILEILGIVEGIERLTLREDRFAEFNRLSASNRIRAVGTSWLAMAGWSELASLLGPDGPLELHYQLAYFGQPDLLYPQAIAVRRTLARLIGRLTPGVWYDLASLLAWLRQLSSVVELGLALPTPPLARGTPARPIWWLSTPKHPDTPLDLESATGWGLFYGELVRAILAGPMTWLGLVDVAPDADRPMAFRVHPLAGLLADREPFDVSPEQSAPLVVDAELVVLVLSGGQDAGAHAFLALAGELIRTTPDGLRYKLTAERVQGLFDEGITGAEILQFLTERSAKLLPAAVLSTIERWWSGYGSIHLYDDVTIVELGDDFLLPELLASTSLRGALVHTFSPRLIAVVPSAVDGLVGQLTRLGHAPRVVEAG